METYLNPVHNRPCPDPFALKHCGEYWCYCTGFWHDGRCFGVLHSYDLMHWQELDGALAPLQERHSEYWAPEVIFLNGRFYMYYSVGDGILMHIRVAVADSPGGPFRDMGRRLTSQGFAIDSHMFQDEDGALYMFYATDFLDRPHVGTGTVLDRMIDPFTMAGKPRAVALAHYDWQVYDPHRVEKGGVRWHTVEGPFVLKRKGVYYEMFSGGNWQNTSYGVSYASAADISGLAEWVQVEHDDRTPLVLRTLPGEVVGPGHNSVVRGPDNRQLFCVYHRWAADASARVLAIDRLDWIGARLAVLGPSTAPQPAPLQPSMTGFAGMKWQWSGAGWQVTHGAAVQKAPATKSQGIFPLPLPAFIAEIHVRDMGPSLQSKGSYGLELAHGSAPLLTITLLPATREMVISRLETGQPNGYHKVDLPQGFDFEARHLVRIEADGVRVKVTLDGIERWRGRLGSAPDRFGLSTENRAAEFRGLELTYGWRDLFVEAGSTPAELGWLPARGITIAAEDWSVAENQLWCKTQGSSMLAKEHSLGSCELVVNARLLAPAGVEGCYGFCPAVGVDGKGLVITIEPGNAGYRMICRDDKGIAGSFELPEEFDPFQFQQFRFHKQETRLTTQFGSHVLGWLEVGPEPGRAGLYVHNASAAFDEVRATALRQ